MELSTGKVVCVVIECIAYMVSRLLHLASMAVWRRCLVAVRGPHGTFRTSDLKQSTHPVIDELQLDVRNTSSSSVQVA